MSKIGDIDDVKYELELNSDTDIINSLSEYMNVQRCYLELQRYVIGRDNKPVVDVRGLYAKAASARDLLTELMTAHLDAYEAVDINALQVVDRLQIKSRSKNEQ